MYLRAVYVRGSADVETFGGVTVGVDLNNVCGRRRRGHRNGRGAWEVPSLVLVVVGARPCLDLCAIGGVAAGQIETETLTVQGDAVVIGAEPLLRGKISVALPDLQCLAACGG